MRLSYLVQKPAAEPKPVAESPKPVVESPKPSPKPAVESPKPAAEAPAPQAAPRRRTAKTGSALSMSAIMDEKKEEEAPAETVVQGTTLPEDETIRMQWKELAKQYTDRPRLASMIANGKIDVREADGVKIVDFFVLNEAQKQWVEEKLLRELENKIREMLSCPRVNILVEVTPVEESAEKVPYMPEEKAKDLMEKNPDVRAFVADLGLDTK